MASTDDENIDATQADNQRRELMHFGRAAICLLGGVAFCMLAGVSTPASADVAQSIRNASPQEVDLALRQVAQTLAKNAPSAVDRDTTFDSAAYVAAAKVFMYQYSSTADLLDEEATRKKLVRRNCADPMMKAFMARGVTLQHNYFNQAGKKLGFDVRIADCAAGPGGD